MNMKPLADMPDLPAGEYPIEPGLLPPSRDLLPQQKTPAASERVADYLETRITRNPRDLLSHVQRALLHHQRGQPDDCFAALIDLFVALGTAGRSLRASLIRQTADLLSDTQHQFLQAHLDVPIKASESLPKDCAAALTEGVSGTTRIVEAVNRPLAPDELLESAYRAIEAGEDQTARIYLEKRLDNDPGDAPATLELLALYKRNGMRDAFRRARTRLSSRRLALPELWDKLETQFDQGVILPQVTNSLSPKEPTVTEYQLLERYHLLPTPAGAYYAVSSPETEPLRTLLLTLMKHETTPRCDLQELGRALGMASDQQVLELIHQAQTLSWIQGYETPRQAPLSRIGEQLEGLLGPLSSIHKGLLVDWNGFAFARHGIDNEIAETLSALATDIAAVESRHSARLKQYLGVASQGWAAVDAYGASRIGAWPLFVGEHRFLLVLQGEPRLNQDAFVTLTWILVNRYGARTN